MKKIGMIVLAALVLTGVVGCKKEEAVATPVEQGLKRPANDDTSGWSNYLGTIAGKYADESVTERPIGYFLPMNSDAPDEADLEKRSAYTRQLESLQGVLGNTISPGNMMAFGSPDSAKMADLIIEAFKDKEADKLKGSKVIFIGAAADTDRVKVASEALGATYIFVEAK
jgi:hypothetical protein